jgi:predicted nicotinamide N-methyase
VQADVIAYTQIARPYLVPEIALRLLTHDSALWNSDEGWLARLGWSAPFWAFAWPGGQVLARYVLDHPETVSGKRVLDFGCGGAVEGIAAMRSGASSVVANDIDPRALVAVALNAQLNGVSVQLSADDLRGRVDGAFDVLLAGDMLYEEQLATSVIPWLQALACAGVWVLVGDAGRLPLPTAFEVLAEYDAPHDGDIRGTTLWRCRVAQLKRPLAKS